MRSCIEYCALDKKRERERVYKVDRLAAMPEKKKEESDFTHSFNFTNLLCVTDCLHTFSLFDILPGQSLSISLPFYIVGEHCYDVSLHYPYRKKVFLNALQILLKRLILVIAN
jgi:hypothetical protein